MNRNRYCYFYVYRIQSDTCTTPDNEDDDRDNIPLAVLRMSKNLFGCEFNELVDIEKEVDTCQEPTD